MALVSRLIPKLNTVPNECIHSNEILPAHWNESQGSPDLAMEIAIGVLSTPGP
jgi:hypothetical protein